MTDIQRKPGAAIDIRSVSKSYDDNLALAHVDLSIRAGEFITLLGASGSGKSTLLNIIAGFLPPTSGTIIIDDREVTGVPPHKRGLGMVFQNYALFPHMNVFENVAFSLRRRRVPKAEIGTAVREALELVELGHLAERRPSQLSGGQQQRIALARAIVFRPSVLLLDEPLGALDKRLRDQLQGELKSLHQELGITFVLVTHDQEEALSMSDRVALMRDGEIAQVGPPRELYEFPQERYVAEFLGESNLLHGAVRDGVFEYGTDRFRLPADFTERSVLSSSLLIRPENISIVPVSSGGAESLPLNRVEARVVDVTYLGSTSRVEVRLNDDRRFVVRLPSATLDTALVRPGQSVDCAWHPDQGVLFAEDRLLA